MAVEEGLIISMKGDAGDLVSSAKTAQKSLQDLGNAASTVGGAASTALATFKHGTDGMGAAAYQAKYAVIDLSHVVRDLPYAIGNPAILAGPFDKMFQAVVSLKQETGSFSGAMGLLKQQLMGGAGVLIAFNLLTTAASLFAGSLSHAGDEAEKAKEKIKTYKDFAEGASGDISKEVTNVQSLVAVLESETAQRNKKLAAIKELKQINPEIFSQLKLEGDTVTGLSAAYKDYVANLNTVMAAKMVQARLTDVTNKILLAEGANLTKSEKEGVEILKRFNQEQRNKEEGAHRTTAADRLQEESTKKLNTLYEQQAQLRSQLVEFEKGIKVSEPQHSGSGGEKASYNFFDRFFSFDPDSTNLSAKKNAELYSTALEFALKNQSSFKGLDSIIFASNQTTALNAARKWWADVQNGIVQLKPPLIEIPVDMVPKFENNDAQVTSYLHAMQQQLSDSQGFNFIDPDKINKGELISKYTALYKSIGQKLPSVLNVQNGLGGIVKIPTAQLNSVKILGDNLNRMFGETQKNLQATAQTISGVLTPAFQSMFSAIVAGQNPLNAFFQAVGQQIEQLISQLIAAAVEALILSALTGGSTSFGKAFGNITGLNVGKHADGGIAYGPSLGWIGEYANAGSNPEVIAPLSKLKGMLAGSAQQGGSMVSTVRGNDIILVSNRTARKQGRGG